MARKISNANIQKIDKGNRFGSHVNCIRINPSNSIEHEVLKLRLCYALSTMGREYITESKFVSGGRADIFCLNDGIAYEVVISETESSINNKHNTYNADNVIPVTKDNIKKIIENIIEGE